MANHLKPSAFITKRQVDNFIEATTHAQHYGMPLNVAATVHWAVAGGPGGGDWRERRKRLFINARHWFMRRQAPWAAAWTVEAGTLGKDVHTHLAFHLPAYISLADVEAYFRKELGDVEARVLDMKPVGPPLYLPGWRRYMLKGMNPDLWDAYGVPSRIRQSQGIVTGQRCGVSRTIDAAARSRRIAAGLDDQVAA